MKNKTQKKKNKTTTRGEKQWELAPAKMKRISNNLIQMQNNDRRSNNNKLYKKLVIRSKNNRAMEIFTEKICKKFIEFDGHRDLFRTKRMICECVECLNWYVDAWHLYCHFRLSHPISLLFLYRSTNTEKPYSNARCTEINVPTCR